MAHSLAIHCYSIKQPFASQCSDSADMADLDINQLLAANLKALMDKAQMTQTALGKKSGVAQNTISLYLAPEKRKPSAKGKEPSGKVTEVARMASVFGLEAWQLLLPSGGTRGGNEMNGWPLSPELLAALQNATPEIREIAESQARALLKMRQRPEDPPETTQQAA